MGEIVAFDDKPAPHMGVLLIAPGGFGKTTALATLPKPLLVGDVDGGVSSFAKLPPEMREGIYTTRITSYMEGQELFKTRWQDGPDGKPFASVALDSFSWFMSNVVKAEILVMARREKMEKQDWGLYLERGLRVARLAHELALREDGCHVVLTAHESDKGGEDGEVGKIGPAISGQLFDILPGMPDHVFFLRIKASGKIETLPNGAKRPVMVRGFQTAADHRTPAKSRYALEEFEPPDFGAIWAKIR